jgi:hypothetical protein
LNLNVKERGMWEDPKQEALARDWTTSRGEINSGRKLKANVLER